MADTKTETKEETKERKLLERDTRNILLGSITSMISSITTLYIVQKYFVQRTATAAVAEARKQEIISSNIENWKPLSTEEINNISNYISTQSI